MVRLSHSSVDIFQKCKRWYYLAKIAKIPIVSDDRFMRRGSCFHECAEWISKNDDLSNVKEIFEQSWEKYNLSKDFQHEHDSTYLMVLEFMKNKPDITSVEFEIYNLFPHFVSYLDSINTNTKIINDYKTSTLGYEEEPYKEQMKRYAMQYRYKFGHKPEKCVVWFVKYTPLRKIEYVFTDEELDGCINEINEINYFIEKNSNDEKAFERCKGDCHVFCPYTAICKDDGKLHYRIELFGNKIKLIGLVDEKMDKVLSKKFSYELKDAYFIKKRFPMANTTVKFWNKTNQTLPIGFIEGLKKTLCDYSEYIKKPLELDIINCTTFFKTSMKMPDSFINGRELRDYQKEAVEVFLEKKIGLLKCPTGSGKTEIAIEIIRRLRVKTLFLVEKIELLNQTKERIEECLGIEVGKIGSGVSDIKYITVATIQTLNKNIKHYREYLSTIRFAIFDESHHSSADTWQRIGNNLINTDHRLLLTGTDWRDDGNFMKVEAVGGQKIYEIESSKLVADGYLMKPDVIFIKDYMDENQIKLLKKSALKGLINEVGRYNNYYISFISENPLRNNIILSLIKRHVNQKILIITRLIDHGTMLTNMIPGSRHIYGETPKKERKDIFDDFKDGKFNVLVSNISIFSEGIDIPSLNIVVNMAANRGNVKTVQLIGRIMRILEGKKTPIYYDFMDYDLFFWRASNDRRKILVKQGYDIKFIEAQNI